PPGGPGGGLRPEPGVPGVPRPPSRRAGPPGDRAGRDGEALGGRARGGDRRAARRAGVPPRHRRPPGVSLGKPERGPAAPPGPARRRCWDRPAGLRRVGPREATMDVERLRALLAAVQAGTLAPDAALARLRRLPYEDLGFAKLDTHRALRVGAPEAVFCAGKTPEQVVRILGHLADEHANVLATRADVAVHEAARRAGLRVAYHETARLLVANPASVDPVGLVVVVSAGTSDLPVAEEAAVTAEVRGNRVERVYDSGVAGLHRLLAQHPRPPEANAIIVVAGMEGALASVVGGLVDRPVVAVP